MQANEEQGMVSLPEAIRAAIEPTPLHDLIVALAERVEDRRAGVVVGQIAQRLMDRCELAGPDAARVYAILRGVLRRRIERMDDLVYISGLS